MGGKIYYNDLKKENSKLKEELEELRNEFKKLKFGGRATIFWASIWGGLSFFRPLSREGHNFLGV